MTRLMQVLEGGRWVDVHTRAVSFKGFMRVYRHLLKQNKNQPEPTCGVRIVTVEFEHLGYFPIKPSTPPDIHSTDKV